MKVPEQSQWHDHVFFVNIENVSHLVLVFRLLTLSIYLFAGLDEYNTA